MRQSWYNDPSLSTAVPQGGMVKEWPRAVQGGGGVLEMGNLWARGSTGILSLQKYSGGGDLVKKKYKNITKII